jgi:hypothetical protein
VGASPRIAYAKPTRFAIAITPTTHRTAPMMSNTSPALSIRLPGYPCPPLASRGESEASSGPAGADTGFVGEARLIEQAYRFELDPSAAQAVFLGACCGAARFWFNQALGEVKRRLDRRAAGEEVSVPWSYKALCSEFDRDWL